MKKRVWLILLAVMICTVSVAFASRSGKSDHISWTLDDKGTLTISGKGTMDVQFGWDSEIKKVVINKGITAINTYAFYDCENLSSVTIPATVTKIGNFAFGDCEKLTSVTIPDGVKEIGEGAFYYCTGLSSVKIADSVTTIGERAFYGDMKLSKITLPKNLTAIGSLALVYTNVKEVTVPDSVKTVGEYAFGYGATLYARIGSDGAKALGKTGLKFRVSGGNCDLLYRYTGNKLQGLELCSVDADVKKLTVPKGVTMIAADAFSYNSTLTAVSLPNTLNIIGEGAFRGCSEMKSLTLPASLTTISKEAFYYWNGTLTFLGNAPGIDEEAFTYATLIAVYPHDKTGWTSAVKKTYGARWISWQSDNAEAAKDRNPKSPSEELVQTMSDNEGDHGYGWNWASTVDSYLVPNADGTFTRVEYTGESIIVEEYTSDMELQWKKTLATELSLWGGFYSGTNYNFLVFGQTNYEENDQKEVFRVVRYSKKWNRMDSASAYGQDTTVPFDAGTVSMDQSGDYLYIHTAHEMYTSEDGLNHQSNITFKLYIPAMSFSVDETNDPGYVSHSFNQIVYIDEGNLIMVDHGDAYPRAITIGRTKNDTAGPGSGSFVRVKLLEIGGETGNNYTGATIGGSKASDTQYIVTGKSIDQTKFGSTSRDNVYVVTASKSDFSDASVSFRWQTNYQEGSSVVLSNPYLIKITGTKLLLIWTERLDYSDTNELLHYVFLDDYGKAVSKVYTHPGKLSDVEPAVSGNSVTWYVTTDNSEMTFYSLDLTNPETVTVTSNKKDPALAGWHQDEAGRWLYYDENGWALTGMQTIDNTLYYFDEQGIMATGWIEYNGAMYYASASGALYRGGWAQMNGSWYYFRDSGAMATGWIADGGAWYYLSASGTMATGWIVDGGAWYYLGDNGVLRTGWISSGGAWYYMGTNGAMVTGWITDGGAWYYLLDSGAMATGWQLIGGQWELFSEGGVWQYTWNG